METKTIKNLVEKILNSEDQKSDKALEKDKKEDMSKKTQNDVFNDLYEIERQLKNGNYLDAPESLNLQKVEVEERSDDDFLKSAENSLKSKYDSKKKSTDSSFESKIDDILKQNESLKKSSEEKKNQINDIYDATKKKLRAKLWNADSQGQASL